MVTDIATRLMSMAVEEAIRASQQFGGVPVDLADAMFELAQLSKARRLTASMLHESGMDLQDGNRLLDLAIRVGGARWLDLVADGQNELDEFNWRVASHLTWYEALPGRNPAEIIANLRKLYGLSLTAAETAMCT